ncbi:MAG: TldD/PmbA family protein [Candidatus Brocadiia bacterium]
MILSSREARALVEKALRPVSADEARVNLAGGRRANTRFARNSITTCGDADQLSLTLTVAFGRRHAAATTTESHDDALQALAARAEELARVAPEDPEYVPQLEPHDYPDIDPYFENTAAVSPEFGLAVARSAIEPAVQKALTVAGYLEHAHGFSAVGNTKGLFAWCRHTDVAYSVTARTPDGSGSGWAADSSRNVAEVDYAAASQRAIAKAQASRNPKALEPGTYPVILEPQAVADLLRYAVWGMDARQADEGRSFFARPGGGNKTGEQVAGENITLRSEPAHPQLLALPFDGEGLPAASRTWVENGVVRQLAYDRYWAARQGVEPTGPPRAVVLEGGSSSLDDLVRETDRAVLVTRFWYIRSLDPQTLLVTGLTRDGLFWVEDGAIRHSIRNFRFNESPIAVLRKVTGLSQPVRVGHALFPALRAREFTFSSPSEAV